MLSNAIHAGTANAVGVAMLVLTNSSAPIT